MKGLCQTYMSLQEHAFFRNMHEFYNQGRGPKSIDNKITWARPNDMNDKITWARPNDKITWARPNNTDYDTGYVAMGLEDNRSMCVSRMMT